MSSICKNCGISGPVQTSKCFPSEVGNDIRHEFLPQAPSAPGNYPTLWILLHYFHRISVLLLIFIMMMIIIIIISINYYCSCCCYFIITMANESDIMTQLQSLVEVATHAGKQWFPPVMILLINYEEERREANYFTLIHWRKFAEWINEWGESSALWHQNCIGCIANELHDHKSVSRLWYKE